MRASEWFHKQDGTHRGDNRGGGLVEETNGEETAQGERERERERASPAPPLIPAAMQSDLQDENPSTMSLPSALQAVPLNQTPQQPLHDDRLVLCIGGQVFQTSRQTLCMDGNSMLAAWVLRHLPHGNNMLWIDRDAKRFKHVLNYLRNGTIWLDDVASLRAVQEEAVFFGLTGLEGLCEERIQGIQAREEARLKRSTEELQEALRGVLGNFCRGMLLGPRSKGEIVAVLRGRRLGSADAGEPVFQMDQDF